MPRWRLLLAALLLGACSREPPRALRHEAYVWQRTWTPAVADAVRAQAPQFAAWRVLALQLVGARIIEVQPDFAALRASRRPVRAVVRIEGTRERPDAAGLAARLDSLAHRWRSAGLPVDGFEIDHDCATAALDGYARWLRELAAARTAVGVLSITALPDWLASPALDDLLAAADASVLQVHAVDRPQQGLFDRTRALAWTHAWAGRTRRAFFVALPAYGVRVGVDAAGAVRAVDAEGLIDQAGPGASELRADAREVAAYLAGISADPPRQLQGWVWFRLPAPGDQRGWSVRQLAAVIAGEPLRAEMEHGHEPGGPGISLLHVRNVGSLDSPAPAYPLPRACHFADGIGVYRLQFQGDSARLVAPAATWLRAGESLQVGWMRCAPGDPPG